MIDDLDLPKDHPSYGKIKISRVYSRGHSLVGSDILHDSFLELTISRSSLDRKLHSDWFHNGEELISIELSSTQWAELLNSFNTEGVPCTLNYIKGEPQIPEPPFIDKTEKFSKEFSQEFSDNLIESLDLIESITRGLDKDTKLSKKEMRELLNTLYCKVHNIKSNVKFAADQFNKNLESRITCAKEQLESYLNNKYPFIKGLPNMSNFDNIPKITIKNSGETLDE